MTRGDYTIDTDLERIDLGLVHGWLSTDAYWAIGRPRETVERAARGSVNFGAFADDGQLVGYARVVTDEATFAWLCDVYVVPAHRGTGVGSLLVQAVVDRVAPLGLRRVMLATLDAHGVYERFGFAVDPHPERLMSLQAPEPR